MKLKKVAVCGAGTMGAGIAQVAAQAGCEVQLFDSTPGASESAKAKMEASLDRRIAKGKLTDSVRDEILDRISISTSLENSVGECDLFIEAIVENLEIKREVFKAVDLAAPSHAILASNTSSLSITAIAASTSRPELVAGMHFFNPAPAMKLVEVVRGDRTSDATCNAICETAKAWGKEPAIARDSPGFIVNRVARPFYGEAFRMLSENLADAETVDRVMEGVGGFRMGPFRLLDLIGVDVNFMVTQSVYHAYFEDPKYRPNPIQQKMVDAGLLGKKSGRGFYEYKEDK